MAKINTSKTDKNSNVQPVGTMPADKLKQFKLTGNLKNPVIYKTRDTAKIAKSVRAISTYRMLAHGVTTHRLPSCLRSSVHYYLVPMSRSDSDNSKDRKGLDASSNTENVANITAVNAAE